LRISTIFCKLPDFLQDDVTLLLLDNQNCTTMANE